MGPTEPRPRRERFPKACRVRQQREFARAQRMGARVACRHFVLLVALRASVRSARRAPDAAPPEPVRLGLVASRKVGPATARNRAKRLVREWFRRRQAELPGGADLLVIARAGAGELSYALAQAELDAALPLVGRRFADLRNRQPRRGPSCG